jgi:hypothetical protein
VEGQAGADAAKGSQVLDLLLVGQKLMLPLPPFDAAAQRCPSAASIGVSELGNYSPKDETTVVTNGPGLSTVG